MRRLRRPLCLVLAILLLGFVPLPATAAETVCFVAANEKLYPLSDDTMPFWSGGSLYVSSSVLDGNDLGIHFIHNRDAQLASLYKGSRYGVIFDLATGNAESRDGQSFYAPVILRGGSVFFPLEIVCRFFNLTYSYTRISYGYLIRIVSDSAGHLTDAQFIDAAGSAMATRYAQYERAHTPPEEPSGESGETNPPAAPDTPEPPRARTVYLVLESTLPDISAQALDAAGSGQVTFLFGPEALSGSGGLLRRLAAGGSAVALHIDASGGAQEVLGRIEAANHALWAEASVKTRLVWLEGADEEAESAAAEAGYCPLRFALNFSESLPSASRAASRIFAAADANHGSCCVLLGPDEAAAGTLSALLASLRAGNCASARLNETVF